MPELPEAETIARTLSQALTGAVVAKVRLGRRDLLKTGTPERLRRLVGAEVVEVARRGKCVVMDFDRLRLVLQLGMSGRPCLDWTGKPAPPHTHLTLTFADGLELRYVNARRIASGVHLLAPKTPGPLARLGPDADAIGRIEFLHRLAGRTAPVKAALLNQAILAGVGNIYADEALFRSGIRPTRRVHRLSRRSLGRLHAALLAVLGEAIAAGGSTVTASNPFADADGELGYFSLAHRVYGRYGRPCTRCRTTLRRTLVAGRTTTYCPRCQR
jgi:formamidopyrimidine-DNA glycosylase